MAQNRFAFLILHYIAVEDTIECVESIKAACDQKKKIVVVDNGSPNDSYGRLVQKYQNDPEVIILHNDENLGFAKGNNVGFRFIKNEIAPDFIIMINNDTLIRQKDFLDVIDKKYEKYNFAVLGPDILTKDGIHQNPWIREGFDKTGIRLFRMKQRIRIMLSFLKLDKIVYQILHKNDPRRNKIEGDLVDVPLHGSALIFSRNYIDRFDGLDDRTFLYFEEEILRAYCKSYQLLMMYSGDLNIYHKEDISTKKAAKKPGIKERSEFRNRIQSSYVYEQVKKELKV